MATSSESKTPGSWQSFQSLAKRRVAVPKAEVDQQKAVASRKPRAPRVKKSAA